MEFTIAPAVLESYPDLSIGCIVIRDFDNTSSDPEIASLLDEAQNTLEKTLDIETFRDHPHIAAVREVHQAFGNNPNKYPPSIQALAKRILKGGRLPNISPIVDLYNVVSLTHIVCAGAEDTDKFDGNLELAYATGEEEFRLIGEEENDPPAPGELVYKDQTGVICRKLNWREGDRTRITENSTNAVVVIEGFPPFSQDDLRSSLEECEALLKKYCGGTTRIEILTKENPSCSLD